MSFQNPVPTHEAMTLDGAGPASVSTEHLFDPKFFLRLLRMRWHIILGATILTVALTAVSVYRMTPLYTAHALVMLDTHQSRLVNATAITSRDNSDDYLSYDPALIENQVQILASRSLAGRVIDKLKLDKDPRFNPPSEAAAQSKEAGTVVALLQRLDPRSWAAPPASVRVDILTDQQKTALKREALIDSILGSLSARARGFSTAIDISYVDKDPEFGAKMANAVADVYVQDQLNAKYEASQTATQWLSDRIQSLADQVRTADVAVQQYKAENNLTETNGTSVVDQQLTALNGQLITARSELAEQEAKFAQVAQLQKEGRADDISQVVASPLINTLRGQETELLKQEADFSTRYGPRHPKMLDLQSQKRNLLAKIDQEVQRVVETMKNDLEVARAREKSLEASLAQVTSRETGDSRARIRLRELEANAASSHSLYDAYLARFKETQGQEGIQMPDSRIISPAVVPDSPSAPNTRQALQIAAAGGLFLGFLLALLVEKLDSGFRTASQVEKTLGIPVLSTIPEISWGKSVGSACERIVDKPMSSFAESIRGLQMSLILSNVDKTPKVVLVTSAIPGEGKTTVSASLARLAATTGKKVLIIDCDLRRPATAKALGVSKFSKGLVEVLTHQEQLEDVLVKDTRTSMHVLPVKFDKGNPPDLLGSEAMEHLIRRLRDMYDLIVIDSAPLLPVNDTRILARLADAAVFVVRWEKTPREAARNAARILADIRAPLTGIVLTRANTKRFHYYSYGYHNYSAYNKYYSR